MSDRLSYKRLFDASTTAEQPFEESRAFRQGDTAPPGGYVYDEEGRIELAVNLALATGRPLLVSGPPGTGKSSLAESVADKLEWRYYEKVVSSRTQAQDLLWTFDAVKRLSDAQVAGEHSQLAPDAAYITPGVLWWAFNPDQAATRGDTPGIPRLKDPAGERDSKHAVVLIDEIDKADPDVPNDLLVPLGALRFQVGEIPVAAKTTPLVLITTNGERDLPRAFLRRCVALDLEPPQGERLTTIARAHFATDPDDATLKAVRESYETVRAGQTGTQQASVAEFLDAVAAARSLKATPEDKAVWDLVAELTLEKPRDG